MVSYQDSAQAFESARLKSLLKNLKYLLIGKENELLSFEKIRKDFLLYQQRSLGIKPVEVEKIIGSFDRYKDFDKYFLPKKVHLQKRWAKIHNLIAKDIILPPVKLYQVGDIYFVVDGHHRVSVSKKMGVDFIDAEVTEFMTDVKLKSTMDPSQIVLLAERENFLNVTGLKKKRPDNRMRITIPGQYDILLRQIGKFMQRHNQEKGEDEKKMDFQEAALCWYDNIYLPAIETIKRYGILEKFPNRTKTDLYIWINEHKRFLSLKYGKDVVIKFAAKDIALKYKRNPFRKFRLQLISFRYRIGKILRPEHKT
jgi:hypothetical protein